MDQEAALRGEEWAPGIQEAAAGGEGVDQEAAPGCEGKDLRPVTSAWQDW